MNLNLNIISPIAVTITLKGIITHSKKKNAVCVICWIVWLFETESLYAAQASFEFMIFKPQPPQYLIYICETPWKSNYFLKHNQILKKNDHKLSCTFEWIISHGYGCMKCEIICSLLLKVLDYMGLQFINGHRFYNRIMFGPA